MGYFWWGLSLFVHTHAFLLLLIVLPYPNSKQWRCLLNSWVVNFIAGFVNVWALYIAILCPCIIVHIDAIREYAKYSAREFQLFGDRNTRMDARIQLLQSQRNYFISGAAMILCIVFPRLISIRAENGERSGKREDILKEAVKEVIKTIREVQEESDDPNENLRNELFASARALLTENRAHEFIPIDERLNRDRGSIEGGTVNADDSDILRDFYDRLRNQRALDRTNNPNNQFRQRLARSRFSSSYPDRNMSTRAPRRFHYGVYD